MKKICLITLAFILIIPSIPHTWAEDIFWIEEYRLEDYSTGQLILEWNSIDQRVRQNTPVLAGDEYKLTFTLNVRQTVDEARLDLRLTSAMEKQSEEVFWDIQTVELPVTPDFNPANRDIRFDHVQGVYEISVIGKINRELTISGTSVVLHTPVDLTILQLTGPRQTVYDGITVNVIDDQIDDYRFILDQKEAQLEEYKVQNVDPAYIQLYENFLTLAMSEADVGLVDNARDILETLEVEAPPVQTGPSFKEVYFIPLVGLLLVLFGAVTVLFVKSRSKLGFISMVVDDQIRELEALYMRAQRIDRTLASRLEDIKERLKEAERA